jgi:hypothetical protein
MIPEFVKSGSTISIPDHPPHYKAGSATDQPVGVNFGL